VRDDIVERGETPIVIEAALGVREKPAQGRRAVAPIGRPLRLEIVDPDLRAGVQVPAGLGEERRHVALRAARLALEEALAALGRLLVEATLGRARRTQCELVEVQGRELGR